MANSVGPASNREDKAVYTETQLSQLKSQKYRPILSHLVLRVAQALLGFDREMCAWDPNTPSTCSKETFLTPT
jgi:hypothetical protein